MNNQDYDKKKQECWEEYFKRVVCGTGSHKYWFNKIFDRAYALGREKETITQEEIEKASVEYANKTAKQYEVCNSEFVQEIMVAFEQGVNFALGKQEKDKEDTVIHGWVARDEDGFISIYQNNPIRDGYDCNSFWHDCDSESHIDLPITSFPNLTWDSDSLPVEIIIKRKKNG